MPLPSIATARDHLLRTGRACLLGPWGIDHRRWASAVAEEWPDRVAWSRVGLFPHLMEGCQALLGGPPEAAVPTAQLLDAAVSALREGVLWVIEDADQLWAPGEGPGQAFDPEVGTLLAAIGEGSRPGGVLLLGERGFAGWKEPLLPTPRWELDEEQLLRRSPWLGRLPALADIARWLEGGTTGPAALMEAVVQDLDPLAAEGLLLAVVSELPVDAEDLGEVLGVDGPEATALLGDLQRRGLLVRSGVRWRCKREVARWSRDPLQTRCPGVLPRAQLQKLAAKRLRDGNDGREGVRLALLAEDPAMASAAFLHGGVSVALHNAGAWRPLRDDALMLLRLGGEVPAGERAQLAWTAAQAARSLGDIRTWQQCLVIGREEAGRVGDPGLAGQLDGELGRALLLAGSLAEAEVKLHAAEQAARDDGDKVEGRNLAYLRATAILRQGRAEEARALLLDLEGEARGVSDLTNLGRLLTALAAVEAEQGALGAAVTHLEEAIALAEGAGDETVANHRRFNQAVIALQRQDAGMARGVVQRLALALPELPARVAGRVLTLRSVLRRTGGDGDGAFEDAERAVTAGAEGGDREGLAEALLARAAAAFQVGRRSGCENDLRLAEEALPPDLDPLSRAAFVVACRTLSGWLAATARPPEIRALLAAVQAGEAAFRQLPTTPAARWLAAGRDAAELSLLGAAATRSVPYGTARLARRLLDAALADSDRLGGGEPALRFTWALALLLSGDLVAAEAEAGRAFRDAAARGDLETRARAAALLGRADRLSAGDPHAAHLRTLRPPFSGGASVRP